jgi:hypothetical protein
MPWGNHPRRRTPLQTRQRRQRARPNLLLGLPTTALLILKLYQNLYYFPGRNKLSHLHRKTARCSLVQTIYFCHQRSQVQQYNMKSSFFFELGVGTMAGFLIDLTGLNQKGQNFREIFKDSYEMLSSSIDYSSIPQMALLVGLTIGLTASALGVKIFGEEKLVYWREAATGNNRFAYYIGKVVSMIPRMVLADFHFTTMFMLLSTPRIP